MKPTTGMRRDTLLCLMIITLLSITNLPASAQDQGTKQSGPPVRYTLTDLRTLGGTFSQAFGVNDKGWVVGFSLQSSLQHRPDSTDSSHSSASERTEPLALQGPVGTDSFLGKGHVWLCRHD